MKINTNFLKLHVPLFSQKKGESVTHRKVSRLQDHHKDNTITQKDKKTISHTMLNIYFHGQNMSYSIRHKDLKSSH